jgi:hypothetical protein
MIKWEFEVISLPEGWAYKLGGKKKKLSIWWPDSWSMVDINSVQQYFVLCCFCVPRGFHISILLKLINVLTFTGDTHYFEADTLNSTASLLALSTLTEMDPKKRITSLHVLLPSHYDKQTYFVSQLWIWNISGRCNLWYFGFFVCFWFLAVLEFWTQGFTIARQALYQLESALFAIVIFQIGSCVFSEAGLRPQSSYLFLYDAGIISIHH